MVKKTARVVLCFREFGKDKEVKSIVVLTFKPTSKNPSANSLTL